MYLRIECIVYLLCINCGVKKRCAQRSGIEMYCSMINVILFNQRQESVVFALFYFIFLLIYLVVDIYKPILMCIRHAYAL